MLNKASCIMYFIHNTSRCIIVVTVVDGSRWLCDNTLASDANGPGSTPGGTLELDTDDHP